MRADHSRYVLGHRVSGCLGVATQVSVTQMDDRAKHLRSAFPTRLSYAKAAKTSSGVSTQFRKSRTLASANPSDTT